ncbi:DsrE family protein [Poseidonibacter lekithochrous]|uniref:DsrE family protein n=1 Tax=Poseidonibacter lekithochrous TaxID=1904463 RepID=UPI0008FCDD48|nr:DsrE family protein [Poseidonibacter lekithochrous]QKJ24104.1 intracellular sulfur oxidation protein, DsrE/DsrF family [Poseidonibacter lekithochrous]
MKKIVLFLLIAVFSYAESTFSDPQPTFDNPRKLVIQLYDSEVTKVNHNLSSIYNILKEYPSESLKVVVIAYGNGMRALKNDYDAKTLTRIQSLMEYDVEFVGCRNTMETMKWSESDFIDDIEYVQAGIVEIIERQVSGYVGIIAY